MHFSFFKLAVMAIVTMTVFLRTEMHHDSVIDGGIYAGAVFYGSMVLLFNGFAALSMTVARLPVFYKHRDMLFYPSWAHVVFLLQYVFGKTCQALFNSV
ncbi:pleiotropic drug resistance protein 1-like [Trifolium pratense]|uniref:Pleiotropic drug resistance protein 1-like n=1 Tax=Trifolium pratense TaxID=57577 RepID=A0A2K3K400_TRIPR|nr:pleiotropic drug resistance protein 1-like [Trifolium pratense]